MEMTLQGVRVHYEISGHGERKVVLLHGWGCSEKLMAGISDALTPDMTVLRVDFPAHGESGFPPQPWGVPDFAANLLELLMKLDFLPCSVIAHSFGGRVAIELAADHPERFEKLILTGAAGIRPKLSSEKSKKSQRYQRLKKLVGVAKKTHLFGSLPDKWQENLVQKYGSRDYAALSPEMRKTSSRSWVMTRVRCFRISRTRRCSSGATATRKRRCGWGSRWKRKLPTAVWWCWKAARISHIWSRRRAFRRLCVSFC